MYKNSAIDSTSLVVTEDWNPGTEEKVRGMVKRTFRLTESADLVVTLERTKPGQETVVEETTYKRLSSN